MAANQRSTKNNFDDLMFFKPRIRFYMKKIFREISPVDKAIWSYFQILLKKYFWTVHFQVKFGFSTEQQSQVILLFCCASFDLIW